MSHQVCCDWCGATASGPMATLGWLRVEPLPGAAQQIGDYAGGEYCSRACAAAHLSQPDPWTRPARVETDGTPTRRLPSEATQ